MPIAPQADQRQRRIDPGRAVEPVRSRVDPEEGEDGVHPAGPRVEEADPDEGARHERDLDRHVDERPHDVPTEQPRAVEQDREAEAREHRERAR